MSLFEPIVNPPLLSYLRARRALRRHAVQTRADFEADRLMRFRDLVRHAQAHSPYYAAIMRTRGLLASQCQPTDFPVLTKRLLHEHFDQIVTDRRITLAGVTQFLRDSRDPQQRYLGEFVVTHTSGSSGEVACFVFSGHDWMRGLASSSRLRRRRLRRTRHAFFGATGGHFGGVTGVLSARQGVGRWFNDVAALDINDPLADTVRRLNAFRPHVLGSYVTGAKALAREQLDGRLNIRPEALHCGGEPMPRTDQAWLEQVFGCPCINLYAATETLLLGVARTGESGMTLFDDDVLIEALDDHCLVTPLFNRTLPLIRYRLDDRLRPSGTPGPHGHYPVIEPVVGRNEWVPRFRNARGEIDFISPHVINEIFVPGVWRFQMQVASESAFRFAVCLVPGLDTAARAAALSAVKSRLAEILTQKGLGNVSFMVDEVADIAVDPQTRKFRLICGNAEPEGGRSMSRRAAP